MSDLLESPQRTGALSGLNQPTYPSGGYRYPLQSQRYVGPTNRLVTAADDLAVPTRTQSPLPSPAPSPSSLRPATTASFQASAAQAAHASAGPAGAGPSHSVWHSARHFSVRASGQHSVKPLDAHTWSSSTFPRADPALTMNGTSAFAAFLTPKRSQHMPQRQRSQSPSYTGQAPTDGELVARPECNSAPEARIAVSPSPTAFAICYPAARRDQAGIGTGYQSDLRPASPTAEPPAWYTSNELDSADGGNAGRPVKHVPADTSQSWVGTAARLGPTTPAMCPSVGRFVTPIYGQGPGSGLGQAQAQAQAQVTPIQSSAAWTGVASDPLHCSSMHALWETSVYARARAWEPALATTWALVEPIGHIPWHHNPANHECEFERSGTEQDCSSQVDRACERGSVHYLEQSSSEVVVTPTDHRSTTSDTLAGTGSGLPVAAIIQSSKICGHLDRPPWNMDPSYQLEPLELDGTDLRDEGNRRSTAGPPPAGESQTSHKVEYVRACRSETVTLASTPVVASIVAADRKSESPKSLRQAQPRPASPRASASCHRRYPCPLCTEVRKTFARPSALKVHMLTHTGEKRECLEGVLHGFSRNVQN